MICAFEKGTLIAAGYLRGVAKIVSTCQMVWCRYKPKGPNLWGYKEFSVCNKSDQKIYYKVKSKIGNKS